MWESPTTERCKRVQSVWFHARVDLCHTPIPWSKALHYYDSKQIWRLVQQAEEQFKLSEIERLNIPATTKSSIANLNWDQLVEA